MRYRLVPTRGRRGTYAAPYVLADSDEEALYLAQRYLGDGPVLVCAAPEGGVVRQVGFVGDDAPTTRRKR